MNKVNPIQRPILIGLKVLPNRITEETRPFLEKQPLNNLDSAFKVQGKVPLRQSEAPLFDRSLFDSLTEHIERGFAPLVSENLAEQETLEITRRKEQQKEAGQTPYFGSMAKALDDFGEESKKLVLALNILGDIRPLSEELLAAWKLLKKDGIFLNIQTVAPHYAQNIQYLQDFYPKGLAEAEIFHNPTQPEVIHSISLEVGKGDGKTLVNWTELFRHRVRNASEELSADFQLLENDWVTIKAPLPFQQKTKADLLFSQGSEFVFNMPSELQDDPECKPVGTMFALISKFVKSDSAQMPPLPIPRGQRQEGKKGQKRQQGGGGDDGPGAA